MGRDKAKATDYAQGDNVSFPQIAIFSETQPCKAWGLWRTLQSVGRRHRGKGVSYLSGTTSSLRPEGGFMSVQNKAVAKRFFDAWNARDLDAFDEIIAPEAEDHDPQNPFREMRGPAGAKRAAEMYHSAYSDGRFNVHEQLAEGDLVVTRWTGTGTHDGELMGMPPTGKWVEVDGITIDRIADGKIAESWTCFDTLGMMQQLGAIPEAQPAGA